MKPSRFRSWRIIFLKSVVRAGRNKDQFIQLPPAQKSNELLHRINVDGHTLSRILFCNRVSHEGCEQHHIRHAFCDTFISGGVAQIKSMESKCWILPPTHDQGSVFVQKE